MCSGCILRKYMLHIPDRVCGKYSPFDELTYTTVSRGYWNFDC